ncbi:MAG: DNA-3-methyladenine glycosylase 2 family protein [Xanthobacteraceae bacterium]|nr:DNA-3-methyladenine glycosylase 2 family protein [Xanthobacteraceae bacterium]
MPVRIDTEEHLKEALEKLLVLDPRFAGVVAITGHPPMRRREGGFPGLARIICGQQLSVAAAASIWGRMEAKFSPLDHHTILKARTPQLQRVGLSMPKIRTFRHIARAVRDEHLNIGTLAHMPAEDAHAELVKVKGIGPWTADIYLMFCVGHADAFASGDLALQEAARIMLKKRKRPDAKQLEKIARVWKPYRSVAARLLWAYYAAMKKRDGVPVENAQAKTK